VGEIRVAVERIEAIAHPQIQIPAGEGGAGDAGGLLRDRLGGVRR
jgi:hypothetical protein